MNQSGKHRLGTLLLTACLAAGVAACGGGSSSGAGSTSGGGGDTSTTKWTVLVYVAADNDLEKAALADLKEMAAEGSGSGAQIVAQVDRSDGMQNKPGYSNDGVLNMPTWTTAKRFVVHKDSLEEISDLGETNCGDPSTLSGFITWGLKTYPATKTALILWDHGGGVLGYGLDNSSAKDLLTMSELKQGIGDGLSGAGKTKFDVLGFDACMMGNLETAYQLQSFSDIFVGSEEVEPAHGWDYRSIVSSARTDATPKALASAIISGFKAQCGAAKTIDACTLAALDTSKLKAVGAALSELGDELKGKTATVPEWTTVAAAQTKTEAFGAAPGARSPFGIIDLWHFSENAPATSSKAQAVRDALSAAVVENFHGDGKPNAHGVSVFFPSQVEGRKPEYNAMDFSKDERWGKFLDGYFGQESADTTPPAVGTTQATPNGRSFDISAPVTGDDLSSTEGMVAIYRADNSLAVYRLDPLTGGASAFTWDRSVMKVTDGSGKKLNLTLFLESSYTDERGKVQVYSTDMNLRYGTDPEDYEEVVVFFEVPDSGAPVVQKLVVYSDAGVASEIDPESGDLLEPVIYGFDTNGDEAFVALGDSIHGDNLDSVTLVKEDAPDGDYLVGIIASDFAGNTKESFADITVGP